MSGARFFYFSETSRYYNPGNLFDEVHLVLTNDDQPDISAVQKTVGRAQLFLYNVPVPSFPRSLGWRPWLLKKWLASGVQLAQTINPNLIRVHGNWLNGYLAKFIKEKLEISMVVSLHTNPDESKRIQSPWWPEWKSRLISERELFFEKQTLQSADWVLPVYEPIKDYAKRRGAKRIKVCYNVLNPEHLRTKTEYGLHNPPRILSVGRQFRGKNPENLIRALARMEGELTLVGDGEYHNPLRKVVEECGVIDRVVFHKAIPNDTLCQMLPDFDIFATHSDYWEISKSMLEPLLTGLPIVLNQRRGKPVPELQGDWVVLVEDTPNGYHQAIDRLLKNHLEREQLGRRAYQHAQERYAPAKTEQIYADIYRSLVPFIHEMI